MYYLFESQKDTDKDFPIYWFSLQMLPTSRACSAQSLELPTHSGPPCELQGTKNLNHHLLPPY